MSDSLPLGLGVGRSVPDSPSNESSAYRWAVITQLSPLRVRLDGDTAALDVTPESLVKLNSIQLGDRIWVQFYRRRIIVLGVMRSASFASSVLAPSSSGLVGSLQTTTSVTPVLYTAGPTLTFVAPPSGIVLLHCKAFAMASAVGGRSVISVSVRSGVGTAGTEVHQSVILANYGTEWVLAGATSLVPDLVSGLTYTACYVFGTNAGYTASTSSGQIVAQPYV